MLKTNYRPQVMQLEGGSVCQSAPLCNTLVQRKMSRQITCLWSLEDDDFCDPLTFWTWKSHLNSWPFVLCHPHNIHLTLNLGPWKCIVSYILYNNIWISIKFVLEGHGPEKIYPNVSDHLTFNRGLPSSRNVIHKIYRNHTDFHECYENCRLYVPSVELIQHNKSYTIKLFMLLYTAVVSLKMLSLPMCHNTVYNYATSVVLHTRICGPRGMVPFLATLDNNS